MNVNIIGCGMEGGRTLTAEGKAAIDSAELLIGSRRLCDAFPDRKIIAEYSTDKIADIINNSEYNTAAVLMSGDTGFFSGAKALYSMLTLSGHDVCLLPGVSSMAYLGAKAGVPIEDAVPFSLHGKNDMRGAALQLFLNGKVFYLLGGKNTPAALCRHLTDYGLGEAQIIVGSDMGYEKEKIWYGKACECTIEDSLSAVLAIYGIKPNIHYLKDELFKRGERIPMTKAEIRCICTDMLNIRSDSTCWDIGCGTGSVSVQMAYKCPKAMVYAADRKSEAVQLTEANARLFSCDNISAVLGECPDIFTQLSCPDKVFIGGSGGNMAGIIENIYTVNPDADIVANAATIDTLTASVNAFDKFGGCDVIQLHTDRTKTVGGLRMLEPLTPIFIIKGRK